MTEQIDRPVEGGGPATVTTIGPEGSLLINPSELWAYRELLFFLVWRGIKSRYKQTAAGMLWAVAQPLVTMGVFTVVFTKIASVPSDGLPYPLFAFTALVPWTYFSTAINRGSNSVVANSSLVTKVYFPRILIPLAAVITPLFDFAIAFAVLVGMMALYGVPPTPMLLWLPLLVLVIMATALAVALWVAAINVRYRDAGHLVGFILTLWMWVTPIAYPVSSVPTAWRTLYDLNPMVGVVGGFRAALLGTAIPSVDTALSSAVALVVLLVGGWIFFQAMQRTFADVI